MKKKDNGAGENTGLPLKADQQVQELRSQAERDIRQQGALPPVDVESLTLEKSQKLLQELQVHQVELTMQNEELRAVQVELEESRARFFELYDLAPVGYLTVSEQGLITLANLTFATLLGVKRSALENTPLYLYIIKEDQDIYYRHRKKLFESGEGQQCELRMVKADGGEFWAKLQATFVPVEDGVPFCRLTLSDITESKKVEEALHKSEERFRVAQDISPDGFTILHPLRNEKGEIIDFTWVYENKAIASINETDPQKVIGKRLLDLFPDHSGTPIIEAYIHVANTGKPQIFEEVYVGEIVSGPTWLRMVIAPMAEDIAILAQDISERKQAEGEIRALNAELEQRVKDRTTELEAVNKELESFAYSISHDFRAPLRALNAFSASLTEKYNDQLDEQGLHYLTRISNAAIYMSNLVDDLLKLSRITRTEVNEQAADISHLVEEILKELQEAEPERRVKMEVAPGLSTKGDIALLKSVLENLLGNAWKFSSLEPQAEIEVGQTAIDGEKIFFVRDNGVGFNMAYADKLFGAFQRLHGVNEFPGTGIGLATAQRIINRHGGRIWATSEVGKGAIFYFTLQG